MENALKPFVRPRTKSSIGCSGITKRACTQPWATSARCGSNKTGIAAPQPLQTDGAKTMKAGYGKAGKQKTLSCFPTATTTTNYNYLWDTDSEGKVKLRKPQKAPSTQRDVPQWFSRRKGVACSDDAIICHYADLHCHRFLIL